MADEGDREEHDSECGHSDGRRVAIYLHQVSFFSTALLQRCMRKDSRRCMHRWHRMGWESLDQHILVRRDSRAVAC